MSKETTLGESRLHRAPGAQGIGRVLTALGLRPRASLILIPYIWLGMFFLIPFLIVLKISFARLAIAQPPFTPLFVCADPNSTSIIGWFFSGELDLQPSLSAYRSEE